MNCFSARQAARPVLAAVFVLLGACGLPTSESADSGPAREYSVHYVVEAEPAASAVRVTMTLRQPDRLLRELSFTRAPGIDDVAGDGAIRVVGDRVRWAPPAGGGTLSWRATLHRERGKRTFDAILSPDWGIFRMEDIIPRAATRTLKAAASRTTLEFDLPAGWSVVTEYPALGSPLVVDRGDRRFDQPTGWVVTGRLGVRRETIAGTRVAVAAPEGQSVRRMEMLALLNWTVPALNAILARPLPRLTIVSAGEPMWRGGLSAPASLFLHADRPLISENATSPLLHEVMHVALRLRSRAGHDWISEGLAEYYGIELLRRGRAISEKRAARAFEAQAEWGRRADSLCAPHSTAATTALAVTVFRDLDRDIMERSDGESRLDDVLPKIAGREVDLRTLREAVAELTGTASDVLHIDNLPGCRSIAAGDGRT